MVSSRLFDGEIFSLRGVFVGQHLCICSLRFVMSLEIQRFVRTKIAYLMFFFGAYRFSLSVSVDA